MPTPDRDARGPGLAFAVVRIGSVTVGGALLGLVLGFALMLPGHLFGATGAGDVKAICGGGRPDGAGADRHGIFYTAIAGGLLALVVAVRRRRLQHTLGATARLIATAAANATAIAGPLEDNRFAYAPAIAVGTC